jgi:hypothetical protein
MKASTTNMDKDTIANVGTIAASGFSLMGTETILTIIVLCTALVLNLVRIWSYLRGSKGE